MPKTVNEPKEIKCVKLMIMWLQQVPVYKYVKQKDPQSMLSPEDELYPCFSFYTSVSIHTSTKLLGHENENLITVIHI